MDDYNESQKVVLVFALSYKSIKEDALTTQAILLEKLLPLRPTSTDIHPPMAKEWVTFYFRLLFPIEEWENTLNTLLVVLINNRQAFQSQGEGCYLTAFEIYITYYITQSLIIKPEQLRLIMDTQTCFEPDTHVSISLNSSSTFDEENHDASQFKAAESNDYGVYYQLFFHTQSNDIKQSIINSWNDTYYYKYGSRQYWGHDEKTTFDDSTYIVLSISTEDIVDVFEWDEIENDMFSYIKKYDFLNDRHIPKITFGVYNCVYDGGEIGESVIAPLIELGMDLLITRSMRPPFV